MLNDLLSTNKRFSIFFYLRAIYMHASLVDGHCIDRARIFRMRDKSQRGAQTKHAGGLSFFHKSAYAIPDFGYRECLIKSLSNLSSTPAVAYNLVVARERKVYIAIRQDLYCPSTIDCSAILSQAIYKKVYLLL